MNNNTIESIEWHKNQLAKLLSDEIGFYKVESELDSILEKAKMKKKVKVTRGGKTFYREQLVGREDNSDKIKKKFATLEEIKKELSEPRDFVEGEEPFKITDKLYSDLTSHDDKTFFGSYLNIPMKQLTDIPDSVNDIIDKQMANIPDKRISELNLMFRKK